MSNIVIRNGPIALIAILTVVSLSTASFGKHGKPVDDTVDSFDFYLLTLSWAPEFCATHSRRGLSSECDQRRHYGFIVHGLWPENNNGSYPEKCAPAQPVAQATVQQMLSIMPDRALIQHEWASHGTCSGLATTDYFTAIRTVFGQVHIPQEFRSPSSESTTAPADVEKRFAAANETSPDAFRVVCSQGELVAVEACVTKELHLRKCGSAVRDCRAAEITVTPVP